MAAVPYHFKALIAAGIKPSKESYVPILVDGPLLLLTVRYQNVLRDLWTIWFFYAFRYSQFNRTMVIDRIATILQDCAELQPTEQDFTDLYNVFFHNVYVCASKILLVLDAAENRERFRETVRHSVHARKSVQTRAAFRPDIKPWNQFANAGAPLLPAIGSLCPRLWPIHVNLPPEYTHLRATSVQTLPPATSAILSKWTADWQRVMEYLYEEHPHDPTFTGPIGPQLLVKEPFYADDDGLIVEQLRIITVGPQPYARATKRGLELGGEDRSAVAKVLGRMEKRGRPWPLTNTTRCYVVRQWKLMRSV
ncbi:hypothetical protein MBLNU457_4175t1 [Dothideomycetes sp. NU457]